MNLKGKKINDKIRVVTFMLAVMVVCIHNYPIIPVECEKNNIWYWGLIKINEFKDELLSCAVPFFFMISGYLFFDNYEMKKIQKIKTRMMSISIPFVIWNVVAYFTVVCFSNIEGAGIMKPKENILVSVINSTCSPLWFLRYLLILVIMSPLLFYLIRNKKSAVIVLGIATISSLVFENSIPIFPNYYLPVWLLRGILALHFQTEFLKQNRERKYVFPLGIILLGGLVVFDLSQNSLIQHIYSLISPLIWWLVLDCFGFKFKSYGFMSCSFFIYVTHFNINRLILGLAKGNITTYWQSWLLYFILPVGVTVGIVCLGEIWKYLSPRSWKFVNGGR